LLAVEEKGITPMLTNFKREFFIGVTTMRLGPLLQACTTKASAGGIPGKLNRSAPGGLAAAPKPNVFFFLKRPMPNPPILASEIFADCLAIAIHRSHLHPTEPEQWRFSCPREDFANLKAGALTIHLSPESPE
jgi:hypothetical protein